MDSVILIRLNKSTLSSQITDKVNLAVELVAIGPYPDRRRIGEANYRSDEKEKPFSGS